GVQHLGEKRRLAPELLGVGQREELMVERIADDGRRVQRGAVGRRTITHRLGIARERLEARALQPQPLPELEDGVAGQRALASQDLRERRVVHVERTGERSEGVAGVPGAAAGQLGTEHGGEGGGGGSGHWLREEATRDRPETTL